jgi:hypothetical protein
MRPGRLWEIPDLLVQRATLRAAGLGPFDFASSTTPRVDRLVVRFLPDGECLAKAWRFLPGPMQDRKDGAS